MIRAVTFDAAGTLIAPREPVGTTYARVARRFGIEADERCVDAGFRRAFAAAPPLAFPDATAAARPELERAWWRRVVEASLGVSGSHPGLEACFAALFDHYGRATAWQIFPDVRPTLTALRRRGLRLGVVSNFDARLPDLLAALGLHDAVDAVVWSTDVGAAKPAGAIFAHAAARLGIGLAETCHVGDDLAHDVHGATAAGARAVHLDRAGRDPGAIRSLSELPRRLGPAL